VLAELTESLTLSGRSREATALAEEVLARPHAAAIDHPLRLTLIAVLSLQRRSLWTGFEDEVEWRLGRAAEAGEAARGDDLAEPRFAGLGAEREPDLLVAGGGCADEC